MISEYKVQGKVRWQVFFEGDDQPYEYKDYFPEGAAAKAVDDYDMEDRKLVLCHGSIRVMVKHPDGGWEATYSVEGSTEPRYRAYQVSS
jgi:hypothetical protein